VLFPSYYAVEIEAIKQFFAAFDLDRYETAFKKKQIPEPSYD
jgi:hypothetical protein